ncbi:radical SAM protein [Thermotoga caldifontis]|uniref:radical SAM protein n=1 Tax=Thermotoga caldifontis TaxID=1508419 RepID=UPI001E5AA642|nr:radical SAM protein [Thermotoga caldifontis]
MIGLIFVDPSGTIPVSLTNHTCKMNCAHCGGHYLLHMKTLQEMEKFAQEGYKSFLISGGLEKDLLVPFREHLHTLWELKRRYGLSYNFHVGFPLSPLRELEGLADVVSFDFFADSKIMREVYGFSVPPLQLLNAIVQTNVPAIPHVTVGIHEGRITHEYDALETLSGFFNAVVLNVFVPTQNTRFSNASPPDLSEVRKIFEYASEKFDLVALGCMQPRGEYRRLLQESVRDFVRVMVKPVFRVQPDFKGCCSFTLVKLLKTGVAKDVR